VVGDQPEDKGADRTGGQGQRCGEDDGLERRKEDRVAGVLGQHVHMILNCRSGLSPHRGDNRGSWDCLNAVETVSTLSRQSGRHR